MSTGICTIPPRASLRRGLGGGGLLALLTVLLLWAPSAAGIERVSIAIGSISHSGFHLDNVTLEVDLGPSGGTPSGRLRVEALRYTGERIGPLVVHCGSVAISRAEVGCQQASLSLEAAGYPGLELAGDVRLNRRERSLRADLRGEVGDHLAVLRVHWARGAGQAEVALPHIPLESLADLLPLPDWSLQGRASLNATVDLDAANTLTGSAALTLDDVTVASDDGRVATEDLSATALIRLRGDSGQQRGTLSLRASDGLAYVDPVLMDLRAHPADIVASALHRDRSTWLERLHVLQPGLLQARGTARMDWHESQPLQRMDLRVDDLALPTGFDTYLQPFLIGTALDRTSLSGTASGELSVRGGRPQAAHLRLDRIAVDDGGERFGLSDLTGVVHWARDGGAPPSRLRWQKASVYRLALGASDLAFDLVGDGLRLRRPLTIPVADGRLQLDRLEATNMGEESFQAILEGRIEPISLGALSQALDWPELQGTIAGRIPRVTYRDRRLTLDGALEADIFDGQMTVPRLLVNDPVGRFPQMQTDILLRGLDQEQLTGAFTFGRITGRLDGDIRGLELLDWEPVAFDTHLYSTPGGTEARRISQRAVENIADLGGGGSALISTQFLRLFDQFRYRQLGIRCRLREEVCRMSGVAPTEGGGYYLVRGAGLPRVDVIGFNDTVDWPTLLEQLRLVTE